MLPGGGQLFPVSISKSGEHNPTLVNFVSCLISKKIVRLSTLNDLQLRISNAYTLLYATVESLKRFSK